VTTKRKWWLAVAGYALLIGAAAVAPAGPLPAVPHIDKALHLGEYWLLAWLLVQAVSAGLPAPPRFRLEKPSVLGQAGRPIELEYLALAWVFATSYGLLIEVIQGLLPWRQMDLADAAVNAVGAALGAFPKRRRS
jgi:VanZ family protein